MTSAQIEAQPLIINPAHTYQHRNYMEYDQIYPFTTENIKDYMPDSTNQDVLAVASSDDHRLNALALGAKSVDTFDINKLTIIYNELKEEIIKHFSYPEFLDFIKNSQKYYEEVRDFLQPETREFWEWYYSYFMFGRTSIFQTNLFHEVFAIVTYEDFNYYFNEEAYNKLKERLASAPKTTRYFSDIYFLTNVVKKQYDAIYLSNIINYQKDYLRFKKAVLEIYSKLLKKNGTLYYGYFYCGDHIMQELYLRGIPETDTKRVASAKGFGKDDIFVLRK